MEVKDCELHSENLLNAANSTGVSWPGEWCSDIIRLSNSLSTYASELRKANEKQQERQSQISKNATCHYWPAVAKDKVDEKFSKLSSVMSEMENEVSILVTEEDHFTDILTPMQKYRLYKDVSLEVSVMVIRYDPGGGCPLIVFMERVDSSFSEDTRYNIALKMLATIEPGIPKYHTQSMRRQFKKTIDILSAEIKPHQIRYIYRSLTGDSSSENIAHKIDERVMLAIDTEDPDLVIDLHELNHRRPGDTFDVFFRKLERQIEQFVAADEHKHGVAHMTDYLSIRDLRKQVAKNLPDGTPIPSESTIIHSFALPNMYAKSSQYYTGRINFRFTIQRRQLRAYHTDAHWCNTLFRYIRELAIQDCGNCVFISCDNKSKIYFGEPGHMLLSGVQVLLHQTPHLSLDHDVAHRET